MFTTGIGNIQYGIDDLLGGALDSVLNMVFQLPAILVRAIEMIFNDVFNGILQNAVLDNPSLNNLWQTFLGIFFVVIPLKIMYEIIKGQMTDNDHFDAKKKIVNAVWASAVAVSIPVLLTFATNLQRESVSLMLSGKTTENFDYGSAPSANKKIKNNAATKSYSRNVIVAVFESLGDMDDSDKYHTAEAMYYRILTNGGYIWVDGDTPKALPLENIAKSDKTGNEGLADEVFDVALPQIKTLTYAKDALTGNNNTPDKQGWKTTVESHNIAGGKGLKNDISKKAAKKVKGKNLYQEPNGSFYAYRRYSSDSGDTPDSFVEEGDPWNVSETGEFKETVVVESKDGVQTIRTGKPHVWNFNLWGILVGTVLVAVMMCTFLFQVAMRTLLLSFYKIISPLCCLSLVSDDTTAFSVWKQSTISNILTTVAQIFMLTFTIGAVDAFNSTLDGFPLAKIAFFIGGLSATITIPSFISAMVGGYSAGVMAGMQQAQSVAMAGKGALMGAIGLGASAAGGMKNMVVGKGSTEFHGQGHSGKQAGGSSLGGESGESSEGSPAVTKRTKGGIAGALFGDKVKQYDSKGNLLSSKRDPSTGLFGAVKRTTSSGARMMGTVAGMNARRKAEGTKNMVSNALDKTANNLGGHINDLKGTYVQAKNGTIAPFPSSTGLASGQRTHVSNSSSSERRQSLSTTKTLSQQSSIKK